MQVELYELHRALATTEVRYFLFSVVALLSVAAPGIIFQRTAVTFSGPWRLFLGASVPMPVVLTAITLGLTNLQRAMGCGNFAAEVMLDPFRYTAAFVHSSVVDSIPWVCVASLLGILASPRFLAFAQRIDDR